MADHILVVDDEALLRRSLAFNLEQAGYRVTTVATAEDALAIAQRDPPDLFLLDIGLPDMDGLQALQQIKRELGTPVIFVTARRRELDEVVGLELGADDYVSKPFDLTVLLARVKAVLRRMRVSRSQKDSALERDALVEAGDLVIDPNAFIATLHGEPLELTPREFDLLHALALQAGNVVPVSDLLAQVWGAEYEGEPQVVYVHIRWLREKIEEQPSHPRRIVTIRGKGYKFIAQEADDSGQE